MNEPRVTEYKGRWYTLTEPVPQLYSPGSGKEGVQCMRSYLVPMTEEEVLAWQSTRGNER